MEGQRDNGFAERLARAVEMSGLSRQDLAEELHVTPQAISAWLSRGTINTRRVVRFCAVCGVEIHWLFTGEGHSRAGSADDEDAIRPDDVADDLTRRFGVVEQVTIAHKLLASVERRLT